MTPKTKKLLKLTSAALGTAGFLGLTILVSTSWNNIASISFGGSTSVLALINELGPAYQPADIIAAGGGSGAGINAILSDIKEIGMASKDPGILKEKPDSEKYKRWEEKQVKTITIAWDGIAIIYKSNDKNTALEITPENLAKVYATFSGVEQLKLSDLGLNDQTTIIPFARNGGSATSGTADAFAKDSNLKYKESPYWQNLGPDKQKQVDNILKNGDYPEHVKQTAESNSQTWDRVKREGQVGAMTYLSAGFVINNLQAIESEGFQVALYNGGKSPIKLSSETISKGYNWFRPFNLMFSLKLAQSVSGQKIQEFINWVFQSDPQAAANQVINKNGFVPLTKEQIDSMRDDQGNLFTKSDVELKRSGADPNATKPTKTNF